LPQQIEGIGWDARMPASRPIVRMQEEIGTGGGGFRFIYAAFLQEAGRLMGSTRLEEASRMM
jgi:hypothetical protein